MTREEEIMRAAIEYAEKIDYDLWVNTEHPKSYVKMLVVATAEDNAKWADEHPKNPWRCSGNIILENDEPEIGEFCIVKFNSVMCIAEYAGFGRWKINNNYNYVTENRFTTVHWMPIPELKGGK